MTDSERIEIDQSTDREWRYGASPHVEERCEVCLQQIKDCECAVQTEAT